MQAPLGSFAAPLESGAERRRIPRANPAVTGAARRGPGRRAALIALILLGTGFWTVPLRPGVVVGQSMAPAFHDGQVFLMARLKDRRCLKRGDVVVFEEGGRSYIKRIRALPGDTVSGVDWQEMSGFPDYLCSSRTELDRLRRVVRAAPAVGRIVHLKVPPGRVFLAGDAQAWSLDSRHFGAVPLEAVKGRVVVASLFSLHGDRGSGYAAASDRGTTRREP